MRVVLVKRVSGMAAIDAKRRRASRFRNFFHSVVLVLGIGALTALCAYSLWGPNGVVWSLIGFLILVIMAPQFPPEAVMRLFNARPVDPLRGGQLIQLLQELARRAELPAVPKLYVIPSPTLNAFAVGSRRNASIAVSEALLRTLTLREVAGVLAHEISHIRNNDLWIMGLADVMSRLTRIMSSVGLFMFFLQLPLAMMGKVLMPWATILLLYFAPLISSLLQLALSSAREYDADLEGALLTGDPDGLASALQKLERYQGRFWEDIFMPQRRIPVPSVLRTHPKTEDRIERLKELRPAPPEPLRVPDIEALAFGLGVLPRKPRFHWTGYWY